MRLNKLKLVLLATLAGLSVAGTTSLQAQVGGPGARPVAVLLCQYADKPNTYGFTPAGILATAWLANTIVVNGVNVDNSLNGFVQEATYGTVNLTGTQAFGWFTLPNPLASYPAGSDSGNACIAAAQANGVNLTPFTYVAVYMNDILNDSEGESWTATFTRTPFADAIECAGCHLARTDLSSAGDA